MSFCKGFALFVVVVCLQSLAMNYAFAAQRCVLLEDFTNASCPPCAAVNPSLRSMLHQVGEDTCAVVTVHAWWPGVDPMYSWNLPEQQARINYYSWDDDPNTPGIQMGVPHIIIDGTWNITPSTGNLTTIRNTIRSYYFQSSPCTIEFQASATGETGVTVTGTVTAEEDMLSSSLRLFAALVSDSVQYPSPPGSNGETLFPHVFRDYWPGTTGQAFTLAAGETYPFSGTLNRDASWNLDSLTVVVFIQDYTTKAVQQAAHAAVVRPYGMTTETTDARQRMINTGAETQYFIDLNNIGTNNDTYDVALEGNFPAGWTHSIESSAVPSDPNLIHVPLNSGDQTSLIVRVNPHGVGGSVDFDVRISTHNEPGLADTVSFRAMGGLNVLLVDDDEGGNFETYYVNAFNAAQTDYVMGCWDANMNPLDASYLTGMDAVVWFTGSAWQDQHTLSAAEQEMIQGYLDQGGKLFLSGQGIGFDCRTDQIFADYLHAQYVMNYAAGHSVVGVAGDPVSDGLSCSIVGGDGANNQTRQSSLNAVDEYAVPAFDWETPPQQGGHPALRITTDTYKVLYLGFGFEAIDNAADRNTLMANAIDWLTGTTSAHNPHDLVPGEFSLGQNYPNPFNPETTIPYMLPDRAEVSLHVFNVLGREVASLNQGVQQAGAHAVNWNASLMSSGIYFYRLDAAMNGTVQTATRKLMLLK